MFVVARFLDWWKPYSIFEWVYSLLINSLVMHSPYPIPASYPSQIHTGQVHGMVILLPYVLWRAQWVSQLQLLSSHWGDRKGKSDCAPALLRLWFWFIAFTARSSLPFHSRVFFNSCCLQHHSTFSIPCNFCNKIMELTAYLSQILSIYFSVQSTNQCTSLSAPPQALLIIKIILF